MRTRWKGEGGGRGEVLGGADSVARPLWSEGMLDEVNKGPSLGGIVDCVPQCRQIVKPLLRFLPQVQGQRLDGWEKVLMGRGSARQEDGGWCWRS